MMHCSQVLTKGLLSACLGLTLLFLGCGKGDEFPKTKVTGKVTHNGQDVKGGSLTFSPKVDPNAKDNKGGKPSSAEVKSDGTYEMPDVVVGKHTVSYSAPAAPPATPGEGHASTTAKSEYEGLKPKDAEIEVKAEGGEINIELVK